MLVIVPLLLTLQAPVRSERFDRVVALEIGADDPLLAGHGHGKRVEFTAEFAGALHVWTSGAGQLDLFLRVEERDGTLVAEDDGSGGGDTPYLKLDVRPGRTLAVFAAAARSDVLGKLELHFVAAPETDATRGASEEAEQAIAEIRRFRESSDLESARALATEMIERLGAIAGANESELVCARMRELGSEARRLSISKTEAAAWKWVLDHRARTLPADHHDLQTARLNLSATIEELGDTRGARMLQEQVFDVLSRTLPDDHPDLARARLNLGNAYRDSGEFEPARALYAKVVEVQERTLPADDPELQHSRANLAEALSELGHVAEACALEEQVFDVFSRTLPDDHPDLQRARRQLGWRLTMLGEYERARILQEKALEVSMRILPADHVELQVARLNVARTFSHLGDLEKARALSELALEALSRSVPAEHRLLLVARTNLAVVVQTLGDLTVARALQEDVLEVFARTLPEAHPDRLAAEGNYALTLDALGDYVAAREIQERLIDMQSRSLPDDHPDLQLTRSQLAITLHALGDFAAARELEEHVLEVCSRSLPADHRDMIAARGNLAATLYDLGELARAGTLLEEVLAARTRTLGANHPDLQFARLDLSRTLRSLGDLGRARELSEAAVEVLTRTFPDAHPYLNNARADLLSTIASSARARATTADVGERARALGASARADPDQDEFRRLTSAFIRGLRSAAVRAILEASSREAEERIGSQDAELGRALSCAAGMGAFPSDVVNEREAFLLSETTRGAALVSARLGLRARADASYAALRRRAQIASEELARLAQAGASTAELARARAAGEVADRELVLLAVRMSGESSSELELDLEALASRVGEGEALLAYRCYKRATISADDPSHESRVASLCAYVVRRATDRARPQDPASEAAAGDGARLERVELGPIEPIEAAALAWRAALGTASGRGVSATPRVASDDSMAGEALRARILDPLRESLAGVERVIVVLDDVLHVVALDALPAGDAWRDAGRALGANAMRSDATRMGDRLRIEVRASLFESVSDSAPRPASIGLLAMGGADYGAREETEGARTALAAAVLRGGAWERGFAPLPETLAEVRSLREEFASSAGDGAAAMVLEGAVCSRENLLRTAPNARFLHVATHGWFAPESVRSLDDPGPFEVRGGEHTIGISPMLVSGLALAGANMPVDATGRVPGLVTAQEISTLDLSRCELAVLSACDTNVGVRRAGQGVASLQRALHMAGARSVITSLWKVPDAATKELMLEFYRRLWIEKEPKWRALWEAKRTLREAKDERGELKYTTRDWAAWVLTGEPR